MYALNTTTRQELAINTSFFKTRKEAEDEMWDTIFRWSAYNSKEAFEDDMLKGNCDMDEEGAWFDTEGGINEGTATITINKIPMLL